MSKVLTVKDFEQVFKSLVPQETRKFVMWTNHAGMANYHHVLEQTVYLDLAESAKKTNKISEKELSSLQQMIKSDDRDNLVVAKEIINNKLNANSI